MLKQYFPLGVLTIVVLAVVIIIAFFISLQVWGAWHDEWSGYNSQFYVSDGICNIAVIPITGDISSFPPDAGGGEASDQSLPVGTYVDDVTAMIRRAENDSSIHGILVRIDSYGGMPVASEVIADGLKNSFLPSVALIREAGTSGGYLVATGADTIIASPMSDVGGIGVTMSYLENWRQNAGEGLDYVSLSSAPFKDYGDPNKPLSDEERALLERDLKIYHDQFVKEVANNRNLPVEDVAKLADGSSMPGQLAYENKLIDSLGNQETTRQWFADQLQLDKSEVIFCEW